MERAELITHLEHLAEYVKYSEDAPALREVIEMLKCSEMPNGSDVISRKAAIDAVQQHREGVLGGYEYDEGVAFVYAAAHNHIIDVIKHLPPAQPEIAKQTEESAQNVQNEDLISRKAAIEIGGN